MTEEKPSEQLILQRIRNSLIEYLQIAASFEHQVEYQKAVPFVNVPNEVINMYEDCVPEKSLLHVWGPPVFSIEEIDALMQFHNTWCEVTDSVPDPLPRLELTLKLPEWELLRLAAEEALGIFSVRGSLPENQEIESSEPPRAVGEP